MARINSSRIDRSSGIVFDRPIGQNQAIQHPLARSWIELEAVAPVRPQLIRYFIAEKALGLPKFY
jgi:acyl-CoA dehydrogenase